MKYYFGLLLYVGAIACQPNTSKNTNDTVPVSESDLKSALPGTWVAVAFRVKVNSFQNTDSSFVMEVKEGEWEQKLQMPPIQTVYDAENRFRTQYKSLSDSLLRTERGIWNVFGDTLMLVSPDATYQYQVILQNKKAELKALIDWDGDGQEDDEYTGIQKLIK